MKLLLCFAFKQKKKKVKIEQKIVVKKNNKKKKKDLFVLNQFGRKVINCTPKYSLTCCRSNNS